MHVYLYVFFTYLNSLINAQTQSYYIQSLKQNLTFQV